MAGEIVRIDSLARSENTGSLWGEDKDGLLNLADQYEHSRPVTDPHDISL
jgi:hypothetical protein